MFFVAYKFFGIYAATATAMVASLVQVGYFWVKHRRFELMHIITLALILILGTATLLSHNAMFIKWKPTAIYWVFALLFIGSQLIGEKPFIERLIGGQIVLPKNIWHRLNISWVLFFAVMGVTNLYIAYHYTTNTWVNFKLFGILGSTIIFGILQSLFLTRYLKNQKT
jgi:intracellular septation protein